MDESDKVDILCPDATTTNLPDRIPALLPCGLFRSQSEGRFQEDGDGLTSVNSHTAAATSSASLSREILHIDLYLCEYSMVLIGRLHSP
jgi:hypothetical protein